MTVIDNNSIEVMGFFIGASWTLEISFLDAVDLIQFISFNCAAASLDPIPRNSIEWFGLVIE